VDLYASGSISFGAGSAKLSSGAMSQLNSLANSLRSNPNCKAVINGNGNGSKIEQQRSWDRVNSVINYMVDKQGIDRDRFIFQYGTGGDALTQLSIVLLTQVKKVLLTHLLLSLT
jgi:outer membrane protein OmpA-like peptidoglycan-associated protein